MSLELTETLIRSRRFRTLPVTAITSVGPAVLSRYDIGPQRLVGPEGSVHERSVTHTPRLPTPTRLLSVPVSSTYSDVSVPHTVSVPPR